MEQNSKVLHWQSNQSLQFLTLVKAMQVPQHFHQWEVHGQPNWLLTVKQEKIQPSTASYLSNRGYVLVSSIVKMRPSTWKIYLVSIHHHPILVWFLRCKVRVGYIDLPDFVTACRPSDRDLKFDILNLQKHPKHNDIICYWGPDCLISIEFLGSQCSIFLLKGAKNEELKVKISEGAIKQFPFDTEAISPQ